MKNTDAMKRMESFAQIVIDAPEECQNAIWAELGAVLTTDEFYGLKHFVSLYRLMTDDRFYKAVETAVGSEIWNEMNS